MLYSWCQVFSQVTTFYVALSQEATSQRLG